MTPTSSGSELLFERLETEEEDYIMEESQSLPNLGVGKILQEKLSFTTNSLRSFNQILQKKKTQPPQQKKKHHHVPPIFQSKKKNNSKNGHIRSLSAATARNRPVQTAWRAASTGSLKSTSLRMMPGALGLMGERKQNQEGRYL